MTEKDKGRFHYLNPNEVEVTGPVPSKSLRDQSSPSPADVRQTLLDQAGTSAVPEADPTLDKLKEIFHRKTQ